MYIFYPDNRTTTDVEKGYFATGIDVHHLQRRKLQLEIQLLLAQVKSKSINVEIVWHTNKYIKFLCTLNFYKLN